MIGKCGKKILAINERLTNVVRAFQLVIYGDEGRKTVVIRQYQEMAVRTRYSTDDYIVGSFMDFVVAEERGMQDKIILCSDKGQDDIGINDILEIDIFE